MGDRLRAVHGYAAQTTTELSFAEGDVLIVEA